MAKYHYDCAVILPETASTRGVTRWAAFRFTDRRDIEGVLEIGPVDRMESYQIAEDCSEPYPGRAFLIVRDELPPVGDGVYRVILHPVGNGVGNGNGNGNTIPSCTCPGFRGHGRCKHAHAVHGLYQMGAFDRQHAEDQQAPGLPTDEEIEAMAACSGW